MLKINSYSSKGAKLTPISLPKEWTGSGDEQKETALLSQAIHVYRSKMHQGLRSTKTRAEVNRTTKKIYRQKGTGGARHGSRKAPIFVGGGVALGPRPVKRILDLPDKIKSKALAIAISWVAKNKKLISAELKFKKTSEAQKFINKVSSQKGARITFVLKKENQKTAKFLKNIKNASVLIFPSITAYDIFFGGLIVLDKEIIKK